MQPFVARRLSAARWPRSFLRNAGLAQTGEISAFDQCADLRHPPGRDGAEAGDAGITIVTDEPSGFGELRSGAFGVAFERIYGCQERAKLRVRRRSVARLFMPEDRLVGARAQQMRGSDPAVKEADLGVAGTEPNGLLLRRDQLLDRPGHEPAPPEVGVGVGPVAVERDYRLVFGNCLVITMLRA